LNTDRAIILYDKISHLTIHSTDDEKYTSKAALCFANMFKTGTGTVVQSLKVATFLMEKAEKKGSVIPTAVLADNLIYGKNQQKNTTKGIKLLRAAYEGSNRSDMLAVTIMGELYYNGYPHKGFRTPHPKKAILCFREAHAVGVSRATVGLAQALIEGKGCPQNIPKAQGLLESIKDKEPLAKAPLKLLYKKIQIDQKKEAAKLLRKKAEKKRSVIPTAVLADNLIYGKNQNENPTEGIKQLRAACDKGDLLAITIMGELYYNGYPHKEFLIPDPKKAVLCFRKAHDKGVSRATAGWAQALMEGKGCPQNIPKAQGLLESITDKEPLAKVSLALLYKKGLIGQDKSDIERHDIAMNLLREAIAKECAQAHTQLGIIYENGERVPRNLGYAFSCYEKASTLGDPHARTRLGYLYKNNQLPHDIQLSPEKRLEKAFSCYQSGHNSGDATSTYYLFTFYNHGISIEEGSKQADHLLQRAYERGELNAVALVGYYHSIGYDTFPKDFSIVKSCMTRAMAGGCYLAYYLSAKVIADQKNALLFSVAENYIGKALEYKYPRIYELLGTCHLHGLLGKEVDHIKAFEYFNLCNERYASPTCKMSLVDLYDKGPTEIRDTEKIELLLQEAALLGSPTAKKRLEEIRAKSSHNPTFQEYIRMGNYLSSESL
jgi:TPR repeat protein